MFEYTRSEAIGLPLLTLIDEASHHQFKLALAARTKEQLAHLHHSRFSRIYEVSALHEYSTLTISRTQHVSDLFALDHSTNQEQASSARRDRSVVIRCQGRAPRKCDPLLLVLVLQILNTAAS